MVEFNNFIRYFETSAIPENILNRGQILLNDFLHPIKNLLDQKAIPEHPWTDDQISFFLTVLSNMDTDKDDKASRVGEREARIASRLHLRTSAGFCHGVGRSGFLTAPQPKAPGASVMYEITNHLAKDFLKKFGLPNIKEAIVVPLCTGMTLALCIGALKPDSNIKKTVILPQIDHDSILKGLHLIGVKAKIVPGKKFDDAVKIPFKDIEAAIDDTCFAIVSLTSFFPPREHDDIKAISKLASDRNLVHVVINAYGVQSPEWMKIIRSGIDAGRIDAIIQSTDKNALTPIGGAIIASPIEETVLKISKAYAGRASAVPIVDFLISMLSLGSKNYQHLIEKQKYNRALLEELLANLASKIGERILKVFNPVAVALSLKNLKQEQLFALGGALYNLRVTGPRVYDPDSKTFGACCVDYKIPYIVMNAAIGADKKDIETAVERLEKAYMQIMGK
jgi:O-phospho-L-seryl-tRNASec:L-selenocysteinyl-tRNA synthase